MAQEKVYSKRVRGDVSPSPTITRFGRVQKLPFKLRIQEKGVLQPTDIPNGRGICLRDIPGVKKRVENSPAKTQQALHQVLFARSDIGARLISNILAFNGWEFTSNRAFRPTLLRRTHSLIMELCRILSLPVYSTKERLIESLLRFLECPTLNVDKRGFKQTSILQYMQPLTSDAYPLPKRSRRTSASSQKVKAEPDQDTKVLWAVPVVSLEVLLARIKKRSMQ